MTLAHLSISVDEFDQIAAGPVHREVIERLRRGRRSRVLLLLLHTVKQDPDLLPAAVCLSEAQAAAPGPVADLLAYPWVSVWAANNGRQASTQDQRHMRSIAAAALLKAGMTVPAALTAEGGMHLPSLGFLKETPQGVDLSTSDLDGPNWTPIRRVEASAEGLVLSLSIDDVDLYRDCHGYPAAGRLSASEVAAWRALTAQAWAKLAAFAPGWAAELSFGLASLVPLSSQTARGVSVSHGDAFGGLAASLPTHAGTMAVTMVHEFQHSKLNALLDHIELYEPNEVASHFVPWRTDPRPLSGALQGLYSFAAVASLWQEMRSDPELAVIAELELAMTRAQLFRALPDVMDSPALTDAGRRFTTGIASTVNRLMEHRVAPEIDEQAQVKVRAAETRWTARHGR